MRVEVFGLQRFACSDSDILFSTGLPTYSILMSIFKYIEPLLSQLTYRPESTLEYIRGHHRALQPVDEFFMVLVRLRLALLEDLAHRFNISVTSVSCILTTWIIFLNQQLRRLISSITHCKDTSLHSLKPNTPIHAVSLTVLNCLPKLPLLCLYNQPYTPTTSITTC